MGVFAARKLVFGRRKWRDFRFWGPFWGVFGDFGVKPGTFLIFCGHVTPPRER